MFSISTLLLMFCEFPELAITVSFSMFCWFWGVANEFDYASVP